MPAFSFKAVALLALLGFSNIGNFAAAQTAGSDILEFDNEVRQLSFHWRLKEFPGSVPEALGKNLLAVTLRCVNNAAPWLSVDEDAVGDWETVFGMEGTETVLFEDTTAVHGLIVDSLLAMQNEIEQSLKTAVKVAGEDAAGRNLMEATDDIAARRRLVEATAAETQATETSGQGRRKLDSPRCCPDFCIPNMSPCWGACNCSRRRRKNRNLRERDLLTIVVKRKADLWEIEDAIEKSCRSEMQKVGNDKMYAVMFRDPHVGKGESPYIMKAKVDAVLQPDKRAKRTRRQPRGQGDN